MTRTLSSSDLWAVGRAAGLDAVGVARAEVFSATRSHLVERRSRGLHGGMAFTYRNPDRSTDPGRALPGARSIVVGARAYPAQRTRSGGRVAAYATADHYGALRTGLHAIATRLEDDGWKTRVLVDDNALVDREAAHRAGIGWYGKNANILLPGRGSWFVLGSVLTSALLEPDEVSDDGCGSCRRCIDGCPTGAIVAPGIVDARRCLAWLLQDRGDFPVEFREALGNRIYGCDECQEVCPPNRRGATEPIDGVDVVDLLAVDDDTLLARHGRWYIPDRDPDYVRRNALVVLGNTGEPGDPAVIATIDRYLDHPNEMLRTHAVWAAERLAGRAR